MLNDPLEAMLAELKKGWEEEHHSAPLQIVRGPDGKIAGGIKGNRRMIVQRDQLGRPHSIHSEQNQ